MACPFQLTSDGHEMQFGTNHLGHFLLVKELLPVMKDTGDKAGTNSRVVVLSSAAHFFPYKEHQGGPIRLDNIDSPKGYDSWAAYVSAVARTKALYHSSGMDCRRQWAWHILYMQLCLSDVQDDPNSKHWLWDMSKKTFCLAAC